jgi:L-seryl-tRNA(Ser) seleniumtransferase
VSESAGLLRSLPKVDRLVEEPALGCYPPSLRVRAARLVLDEVRAALLAGTLPALPELVPLVAERARSLEQGRLVSVINATGVVVHTNLGRAPWSESARAAALRVAGYCDLEMDLDSGRRGGRLRGVTAQLRQLVGAEAALVVNNCAAAVLLALTALAAGKEVIVSRGELVEIGGSFRVPDVISSGGARLREVGTTNRTRIGDFARAIGPEAAVLLRVHPSNFRTQGFVEAPSRAEVAQLARERGLLSMEDLGSGSLAPAWGEPSVREVLEAGIDLVMFSGDKLLGGPQAGVVAGRAALVERLRAHPLYRALRVDKVILAALEATLGDHLAERPPPVMAMLQEGLPTLQLRARRLAELLQARRLVARVLEVPSVAGGGTLPGFELPSVGVHVPASSVDARARALRVGRPAVVARVHEGGLLFDVRTVREEELNTLAAQVAAVLGEM